MTKLTDYVDASIDAQRAYAEGLFARATERVEAIAQDVVNSQLSAALATLRSRATDTVGEKTEPKAPPLRDQNAYALQALERAFATAAQAYEAQTGLRVRSAAFGRINGMVVVRPCVSNL